MVFHEPIGMMKNHYYEISISCQTFLQKLVIIPTSAPAESVFSVAGITIVNDQARLLPENANKLLLLCEALLSIGRYKESILSYN